MRRCLRFWALLRWQALCRGRSILRLTIVASCRLALPCALPALARLLLGALSGLMLGSAQLALDQRTVGIVGCLRAVAPVLEPSLAVADPPDPPAAMVHEGHTCARQPRRPVAVVLARRAGGPAAATDRTLRDLGPCVRSLFRLPASKLGLPASKRAGSLADGMARARMPVRADRAARGEGSVATATIRSFEVVLSLQ